MQNFWCVLRDLQLTRELDLSPVRKNSGMTYRRLFLA